MKTIRLFTLIWILLASTTAFAATQPVPDTGITKCYDETKEIPCPTAGQDYYGQDANYNINPMSYTTIDGTMVKDNVTGLIWELKNNKDGKKDYTNPHDADNTYTWYDSNSATNGGNAGTAGNGTDTEDFIKALNDAKFGGYSDWRLPTIKELTSIVDYSIPYPGLAIDTNVFKDTVASFYWSSSTYVNYGYIDEAWGVYFHNGYGHEANKNYNYYVRAVRSGQ